jgi:flagellar M-ring protein FliF
MPVGEVRKISIAVLVDGIYTKDDKGADVYQERPKKEIESLEDLVRKSAGFNSQRGDQVVVTSMPFNRTDSEQGMVGTSWQDKIAPAVPIIKYVVIMTGILLAFLFIIRPLVGSVIKTAQSTETGNRHQLSSQSGVSVDMRGTIPQISIPQLEEKQLNEVDLARHLAGTNAQKYAELLRNWLK